MTPEQENAASADTALSPAERVRAEFDRSFAEPVREAPAGARDYVLVAAGGEKWALALDGLRGIEHDRPLVPMPSSRGSMLGVAGVGSMAVPVFDLAALAHGSALSRVASGSAGAGKRLVFALLEVDAGQAAGVQRVGIAFERLLQFARVPAEAVMGAAGLRETGLGGGRVRLEHEQELYTMIEADELLSLMMNQGAGARMKPAPGLPEQAASLSEKARNGDTTK